jgi:subtilisin
MKRWLVLITLLGMMIFPTNSSAEQSSKYLIHSTVYDIQKMMKQENVTASFELLPIVELELTPTELQLIKKSYPNASVSLVQEYEIAAYTDKVPSQFPMIKTAPTQTVPYTGKGVKVGVLDTGIDVDHPDLKVAGGICTMDIENCSSGTSYDDDNGHGTHVAGIIAALQNNQGIVGIAPNVELYAIKSLGRGGSSSTIIAKGIEWAINNNIDILNLSITTTLGPDIMQKFIEVAYDSGMIIVGAAGNEGATRGVQYPALYEDVIAISSVNSEKKITATSSTGEKIELAAPGFEITSTYPLDKYADWIYPEAKNPLPTSLNFVCRGSTFNPTALPSKATASPRVIWTFGWNDPSVFP